MEIAELLKKLELTDIKATDEDGNTALHLAVKNETLAQKEIVEILKTGVGNGIDINSKNNDNETVLQLTVAYRMKDAIEFLLTCKANKDSAVHFFIENEYKRFQEISSQIDNPDEHTDEIQEMESESANFVEWMISKGFDFDYENKYENSALYLAIDYNLQHVLPVLFKCTKNISFVESGNRTWLHLFLERKSNDSSINKNWYSQRYAINILKVLFDRGVPVHTKAYESDHKDTYYYTPFETAMGNQENISIIEVFIDQYNKINHKYHDSKILLQSVACYFVFTDSKKLEYYLKILTVLIVKGIDVNEFSQLDVSGKTVLCRAVEEQKIQVIEFFRDNGVDFSVTTENNENLLHLLAKSFVCKNISNDNEIKLLNILISKGCEVNAKDVNAETPLYKAISRDKIAIAEELVKHGAEVNCKTSDGMTPLLKAVNSRCDLRVISLLEENGADFNATTNNGENLLHIFFKKIGYRKTDDELELAMFNLLANKGCQVNAKDVDGKTPLHMAAEYNNLIIAEKLINLDADVNSKTNHGMTPLLIAADKEYNLPLVQLFSKSGADFKANTRNNENLLHLFAKCANIENTIVISHVNLLITKGCLVNQKDIDGNTPLHVAANNNNVTIVQELFLHGADVNCKTSSGLTPLYIAAMTKHNPHLVELLKQNGADFSVMKDNENFLQLLIKSNEFMKISEEEQIELFRLLIIEGCQINAKDQTGSSLIHLAAAQANDVVVRTLIEYGADVNCRNNKMETPLHLAMTNERDVIEVLLKHGANVNAKDSMGSTALHKIVLERPEITGRALWLLLEYGAGVNIKDLKNRSVLSCARLRDSQDYQATCRDYKQKRYYDDDYYDNEEYDEIIEWASWIVVILAKYSIKLMVANLPWDQKINTWLGDFEMYAGSDYSRKRYEEEYWQEITKLMCTFIDDNTSLYNLLHMNPSRRCAYINNETLQEMVDSEDFMKEFPEYSILILGKYREAVTRKSFLERAKETWLELTNIGLPDPCVECIFSFLSNSELLDMMDKEFGSWIDQTPPSKPTTWRL